MRSAHILVVDDEPHTRTFICDGLSALGITDEALGVSTADEALAEISRHRPDLVITDVRMPGLNGLELQKRLMDSGEMLPIIFLTAYEDPQARRAALQRGAVAFLQKPADEKVLFEAIKEARGQGH